MDWQVISSTASAVAAVSALITAILLAWQARLMRQSISVDALLRLDAYFNSPDMRALRRKAAAYLTRQKVQPTFIGLVYASALGRVQGNRFPLIGFALCVIMIA